MSDDNLTYREYRNEIESLAEIVEDEHMEYHDHVSDAIFEAIDGHQWIIYNSYHTDVIDHADNEPEEWQVFAGDTNDYRKVLSAMAFCAMRADLYDELRDRGNVEI